MGLFIPSHTARKQQSWDWDLDLPQDHVLTSTRLVNAIGSSPLHPNLTTQHTAQTRALGYPFLRPGVNKGERDIAPTKEQKLGGHTREFRVRAWLTVI